MKFIIATLLLSFFSLQASADHPRQDQMAEVKLLAHEAAESAKHTHVQAENELRGDRRGRRTLAALHEFAEEAKHFHTQVETYFNSPEHTERDFYDLIRAYRNASYAMDRAHFSQHVMRDWYKAEHAMDKLNSYYRVSDDEWNN